MTPAPLSWLQIIRLGLVQSALGAIVVLTTSTLNRVMVVELSLPAIVPGALVALHYAMQILRPRLGHGSDVGGRRTPWIVGGMAVLALGGVGASAGTAWMGHSPWAGIGLATVSFVMIGIGVGACGTTLLVLLAKRVAEQRRVAAATIVWVMMIAGIIVTTAAAGQALDPYSPARLVAVACVVSALAMAVTVIAVWNIEGPVSQPVSHSAPDAASGKTPFAAALGQVWKEPQARRFAVFVFISMLAYSAPELILEPFAGSVFGLTVGETTTLASFLHGGVLVGMAIVALVSATAAGRGVASLQTWTVCGCIASAVALANLAVAGLLAPAWPLRTAVFVLGLSNGVYAVAAIGSMMSLVGSKQKSREGVRMGLWGAAQAVAFGLGGFSGMLASDVTHLFIGSSSAAYAAVFVGEAALFLVAALLAVRVYADERQTGMPQFAGVAEFPAPDASRSRS
jgi:BCD family chlorophyll transporter-like MFS transporter